MNECMRSEPADKITVKNIVEGCGVTRRTFYRNFLVKYDLTARRTSQPLDGEMQFLLGLL